MDSCNFELLHGDRFQCHDRTPPFIHYIAYEKDMQWLKATTHFFHTLLSYRSVNPIHPRTVALAVWCETVSLTETRIRLVRIYLKYGNDRLR